MVYIILIFIGLACGSFVNALIWRIHEQESSKKKRKDPKLSITKGRSMCPHCGHELAAKDLIPVLSWVSLGGKCRYCKKDISPQYPIVELATAALFAWTYSYWPDLETEAASGYVFLAFALAIVTGMMALFVYDLKWMILPDRIIFPMIGIAVAMRLYEVFNTNPTDLGVVVSAALGALVLGGLFYVLYAASKGRWIGGGDVKLGIFIGILLGPILAYLSLMIACLLGSIIILSLIGFKIVKRDQQVPFGPFLLFGTYIAMLYGQQIVDWYSDAFMGGLL